MQQMALFDYNQLGTEDRIVVQQRTGEIKELVRTTAENVVRIGEKLVEVRSRLDNGRFTAWIKAEFDWSRRTAYNFISVFEQFGSADLSQLDIATSALYLLASPSTPPAARAEALERAESGEQVGYSDTEQLVREHKKKRRKWTRRNATVEERLTPCDCCQWPISTRAHLLPVAEFGDSEFTVQLCQNCHELYDIIAKVMDLGEQSGETRAARLLEAIGDYWGSKHPTIVYLTGKAKRVHQARQILREERDDRAAD